MDEVVYIDWMTIGVVFGLMGEKPHQNRSHVALFSHVVCPTCTKYLVGQQIMWKDLIKQMAIQAK
jgi:hypothetical protein